MPIASGCLVVAAGLGCQGAVTAVSLEGIRHVELVVQGYVAAAAAAAAAVVALLAFCCGCCGCYL